MYTAPSVHSANLLSGSLADALIKFENTSHFTAKQRQDFVGAIRSTCKLLGREPASVPASIEGIQALLQQVPDAVRTRSRKTVANLKSRLKAGLFQSATAAPMVPRGSPLTGSWAALYARLPDARFRNGLSRIMRIACHQGVRPDQISDEFVATVVDAYRQGKWGGNVQRYHRSVVTLWNEAVSSVADWPQCPLTLIAGSERPKHLPLSDFPTSFVDELEAYLRWLSGADLFADPAPPTACKPTTINLRRASLRLAASTLAEAWGDVIKVSSLRVLVVPDNVKTILNAYRVRAGNRNTAFVSNMAVTLLSVARHWLKLEPESEQMRALKGITSKVSKLPSGLTVKNQHVLRQLQDPAVQARLLKVPSILADQARNARLSLARRVQRFQIALAIELLLVAPIRLQNLSSLQFNKQLIWPTGPDGSLFIVLQDEETKNAQPLEYEVSPTAKILLHEYRDRYRVLLKPGPSSWLFIRAGGLPMTSAALRDGITKAIRREVGIHMVPHQFRHFAAQTMLAAFPGGYPIVKDLLGHKNLKTTASFYSGRRSREAGKAYDEILRSTRSSEQTNSGDT